MTNEERLKAAGWRPTCDRKWPWTRDGKMWFAEDEALVVVLTAERDAAIARAERAEADFANACSVGRLAEARADRTRAELEARAEAAEALAASRPEITPAMADEWYEWYAGEPSGAFFAALRAHAAKVSR